MAADHFGPLLVANARPDALDDAASAFEAEWCMEVDTIQAQQSGAIGQLRMMKFIAPIILIVPDAWINGLFGWYLRRAGINSFTEGVITFDLQFKPGRAA